MNLNRIFRCFEPLPTIIVLVVALPFLIIGLSEARQAQLLLDSYAATTGTIIGNDYLSRTDALNNAKTYWSYHPVVSFRTSAGAEITFTDQVGSYPAEYAVGDAVDVRYQPETPQEARVYRWINLWFSPLLFIALGLLPILTLIGWTLWRDVRAERKIQAERQARWG